MSGPIDAAYDAWLSEEAQKEVASLRQRLAASEAACAKMRKAMWALAGAPSRMLAYCQEYKLEYASRPVPDHWRIRIAEAALASDAGTALLAELVALRAVAEAAQLFRQSQTLRLVHAVIEGKKDKEGTRAILKQQVQARYNLDIALAALPQAQQTHQDGQEGRPEAKDEAKGDECGKGAQT